MGGFVTRPTRMTARAAAVAVAALIILGTAASVTAQSLLQESADAARTGFLSGAGPREEELAFRLHLPGSPTGQVLLVDGAAYVLTRDVADQGLTENALWRIDLATGRPEQMVTFQPPKRTHCADPVPVLATRSAANCYHSELLTDGSVLFIARDGGVDKVGFDGEILASWNHAPYFGDGTTSSFCGRGLALEQGVLYVLCTAYAAGEVAGESCCPNAPFGGRGGLVFLARLSATDLAEEWLWVKDARTDAAAQAPVPGASAPCPSEPTIPCPGETSYQVGFAIVGPIAVVLTLEEGATDTADVTYWGIDKDTGALRWLRGSDSEVRARGAGVPGFSFFGARPTGTADALFLRVGNEVQAVNPVRADTVYWRASIGARDPVDAPFFPTGTALVDGTLFIQSHQTLYGLDTRNERVVSEWPVLDPDLESFGSHEMYVTDRTVYAMAYRGDVDRGSVQTSGAGGEFDERTVYAWDRDTGDVLFRHVVRIRAIADDGERVRYAVGGGVLVMAADDGLVTVLGRTGASLRPDVVLSGDHPAVGAEVRADISGSSAGAFGPPDRFRADWGDGTVTNWTADPVLTHRYGEPGGYTARFWAANDAGQSSVATRRIEAGGTPPVEPNLVSVVFAPENQFATVSILAVVVVAAVVAVGARRRRHRHLLAAAAEDRLAAYREVMHMELRDGARSADLASRLRPVRAALGISDRQHAHLDQTLRARLSSGTGLTVGDTFLGRYEVIEHLGAGGGGAAYLSRDTRIGRRVVLKALALPPAGAVRDGVVAEAHAFGAVDHPNVVTVHDVEQVGDDVYLVLEYVEGGTLSAALSTGPIPQPQRMRLARDLLGGLGAVHGAGLVHRDVKPANILLAADGSHKMTDFGIAGVGNTSEDAGRGESETVAVRAGAVGGTVPYMSAEQARGTRTDHRSDLYSAGAVLWEACTGRRYMEPRPSEGATALQMRIAAGIEDIRLPDDASPALREWLQRALHPDADARFQNAADMLAAYEATDG